MTPPRASSPIPHRPRLLVVEDEPVMRAALAQYFSQEGFEVTEAGTAEACRKALRRQPADVIFIDVQLPDENGVTLAQDIRNTSAAGIVFVTSRDGELDRILGLELAGDDYVTKPVNLRELLARTRALLRRRQLDRDTERRNTVLRFGNHVIDLMRRELVTEAGIQVRLTRGEFDLLAVLVQARGMPVARSYLVEAVSHREEEAGERTVDTLIGRLRRKLADGGDKSELVVTVGGIGYRLGVEVEGSR
ncbi:response regulator transcription factor [Andreprevotia chitinilytica]|uniref:response regulator transcription factor n=1 Tax=Andreprevotia chitinilytica TaxID=396808 RepID=UPI00068A048A|nr:response regulator transcription factor [Andreprevotia chitinilytica]